MDGEGEVTPNNIMDAENSDTPRTIEAMNEIGKSGVDWHHSAAIMSKFACSLERELKVAKANEHAIAMHRAEIVAELVEIKIERDELRRQNERLVDALNGLRLAITNDGVAVKFNNDLSRTALQEALRWATQALAAQPEVPCPRPPMTKNASSDFCELCGAPEIDAMTPRTVYACGSSDYDKRPGTFRRGGKCNIA